MYVNNLFNLQADYGKWLVMLQDLFVFFATTPLKDAYKEYLHLLVMKSGISPVRFLCKFFTEEGMLSLMMKACYINFVWLDHYLPTCSSFVFAFVVFLTW